MSETKSTQDWLNDWQALQKQYWNAWSQVTQQADAAKSTDSATPWHEGTRTMGAHVQRRWPAK